MFNGAERRFLTPENRFLCQDFFSALEIVGKSAAFVRLAANWRGWKAGKQTSLSPNVLSRRNLHHYGGNSAASVRVI